MGKHLVLAGGGHAHLTALKNIRTFIDDGHRVTVVSPSEYHYYSGMGPGMLSGTYRPQDIRFNIRKMVTDRGGAFVEDRVVHIDASGKRLLLASNSTIAYDVASFNTGSSVPKGIIDINGAKTYTVKPIVNLFRAREEIISGSDTLDVAVIGGGPAGVELAGNLLCLLRDAGRSGSASLVAGTALLNGFPERVRSLARKNLCGRGCTILEGVHARAVSSSEVVLTNGSHIRAAMVFLALGVKPSSLFSDSNVPAGPDGGLLVNDYLQSPEHPELFGGGDCICLDGNPLAKVGVYAVRENPVLFHNLRGSLNGTGLRRFDPGGKYLLIFNLGQGYGVLNKGPVTFNGRFAFTIKDYIDRRFMRKFQLSGEIGEPLDAI